MFKLCLVLFLFASVHSESVRETETWMPMKTSQQPAEDTHDTIVGSGDSPTSDFAFDETDDDEDDYDDYYTDEEDDDDDEEMSGSGDGVPTVTIKNDHVPSSKPDINENKIPEMEGTVRPRPDINEIDLVRNHNEIPQRELPQEHPSNVLMSHASENESFINKTEVLAAVIVGGAVTLLFAVLLILLLIYRMKKKDEGSYDLGKKPIYKKAPTTEIYA